MKVLLPGRMLLPLERYTSSSHSRPQHNYKITPFCDAFLCWLKSSLFSLAKLFHVVNGVILLCGASFFFLNSEIKIHETRNRTRDRAWKWKLILTCSLPNSSDSSHIYLKEYDRIIWPCIWKVTTVPFLTSHMQLN